MIQLKEEKENPGQMSNVKYKKAENIPIASRSLSMVPKVSENYSSELQ